MIGLRRIYRTLRLAVLRAVPVDDDILARLLNVAFHVCFREWDALQFNWDSVAAGTELQELQRCTY